MIVATENSTSLSQDLGAILPFEVLLIPLRVIVGGVVRYSTLFIEVQFLMALVYLSIVEVRMHGLA